MCAAGWMKMVTVAALFVAYQLLLLAILGGRSLPGLQPGLCTALGLAIQFSFLAAFCWMSAMAGEVWATFRQLAGSNYSGGGTATLYHLSIYCLSIYLSTGSFSKDFFSQVAVNYVFLGLFH